MASKFGILREYFRKNAGGLTLLRRSLNLLVNVPMRAFFTGSLFLRLRGRYSPETRAQVWDLFFQNSSHLKGNDLYNRRWRDAGLKFVWGDYEGSRRDRRQLLEEIRGRYHPDVADEVPYGLSSEFGTNMGHIGVLYAFLSGQEAGIIPSQKRVLPIEISEMKNVLLSSISEKCALAPQSNGLPLTELPSQWHNFERLSMPLTVSGYEDIYRVFDHVYKNKSVDKLHPLVRLPETYLEKARSWFIAKGLPKGQWFVGLHVRNDGSKSDQRRNQSDGHYLKALEYLFQRGGWVVRIGDSRMKAYPEHPQFLDLSRDPSLRWLHPFVMSNSLFFIGTMSGPTHVASAFGTPILATNATAIGRNSLLLSKGTLYIPKIVLREDGSPLNLSETLASPEGYGELSSRELAQVGLRLLENSPDDILNGTKDIFRWLENPPDEPQTNSIVEEVRSSKFFASRGEFAPSFLDDRGWWAS